MALARFAGSSKKHDPFRNFNFRILLDDVEVAACRKVSGLTASVEVVKFRAGNSLSSVDEMLPGRVAYEAITLESGITNDTAFKDWANTLIHNEFSKHQRRKPEDEFRRKVTIMVFDIDQNQAVKKYIVHNAWISKFTALSELAADANEVAIETIELQHEGFVEEPIT